MSGSFRRPLVRLAMSRHLPRVRAFQDAWADGSRRWVMRWRAKPAEQVDRGLKQSFVETAGDVAEVLQAVEESAR